MKAPGDALWECFLSYLTEEDRKSELTDSDQKRAPDFIEWVTYRVSKWHLEDGRPCKGPDGNR